MFRFHDALDPCFHLAGLLFPGREEQSHQLGTEESEHIFDNYYKRKNDVSVVMGGGCRGPAKRAGIR
jgi:hypothetical protein